MSLKLVKTEKYSKKKVKTEVKKPQIKDGSFDEILNYLFFSESFSHITHFEINNKNNQDLIENLSEFFNEKFKLPQILFNIFCLNLNYECEYYYDEDDDNGFRDQIIQICLNNECIYNSNCLTLSCLYFNTKIINRCIDNNIFPTKSDILLLLYFCKIRKSDKNLFMINSQEKVKNIFNNEEDLIKFLKNENFNYIYTKIKNSYKYILEIIFNLHSYRNKNANYKYQIDTKAIIFYSLFKKIINTDPNIHQVIDIEVLSKILESDLDPQKIYNILPKNIKDLFFTEMCRTNKRQIKIPNFIKKNKIELSSVNLLKIITNFKDFSLNKKENKFLMKDFEELYIDYSKNCDFKNIIKIFKLTNILPPKEVIDNIINNDSILSLFFTDNNIKIPDNTNDNTNDNKCMYYDFDANEFKIIIEEEKKEEEEKIKHKHKPKPKPKSKLDKKKYDCDSDSDSK